MKAKHLIIIFSLFLLSGTLSAQDSATSKTRTFQVSFITPLGSNGIASWNVTNKVSLNILAGYAGGIRGVEFTGLVSVLQNNLNGAQFAGLGNIVLNDARGAQFAGLMNINAGISKGFQTAGLLNINAGATNSCMVAGFMNLATGGKATMLSGFTNINAGADKGAQITGFANINSGKLHGVQLAGFFNYAGKLSGVQIGTFNYVDSLEHGVPIGFLSFVRNGYMAFELSTTETLYGVMSFKTGTRKFYNILSVGGGYRNDLSLFAWGYGLGTLIPLGKKVDLGIEGLCYQVNEGEWFTDRLNLLNKVSITAAWNIQKHLTIFGGPSWNVTVSDVLDETGDPIVPNIAPWEVFNETTDNGYNIQMYPGFTAGIRF
jgi:hypothetical protein